MAMTHRVLEPLGRGRAGGLHVHDQAGQANDAEAVSL